MSLVDTVIALNQHAAGKDKIARLIQYTSRALWDVLQSLKINPVAVEKLKSIEYTLSTFRKLLRFGKSFEVLYSTLKTIHYPDLTIRLTVTLSKIASALFLLTDHILWIGRSGLSTIDTSKWANLSNRYWLYSILMNLVRDLYEIKQIVNSEGRHIFKRFPSDVRQQLCHILILFYNDHKNVFWDTLRNSCDIWIPMTALGYTQLKPRTVGVLGTVSSVAGIVSLIQPSAKLVPS